MGRRGWNGIGLIALILAIVLAIAAFASGRGLDNVLGNHGVKQSDGTYQCTGNHIQVAMDIAQDKTPDDQTTDSATGTYYLRYGKDVVSVADRGPTGCLITIEPRSRVSGGGFIFLGPGFGPSSPSKSSGGTSGGGGVK